MGQGKLSKPKVRPTNYYSDTTEFKNDLLEPLTDFRNEYVLPEGTHLYHFPGSLCSQKVRQMLDEAKVTYTSHVVNLPKNEQYNPSYVRINPRCVVPTLVVDGKVTTDAANIIGYINKHFMVSSPLYPVDPTENEKVSKFVKLGESIFIGALTHGKVPGIEHGGTADGAKEQKTTIAETLKKHQAKIDLLNELIQKHKEDDYLRRCYETKLQIVDLTKENMSTEKNMQDVVDVTKAAFDDLALQLKDGPFSKKTSEEGWLCSEKYSLADLLWGIVMFRLQKLRIGKELLWKEHEIVNAYAKTLFARESFKSGVLEWLKKMKK